ncbi:MAG: flagellar hook capping protein [Lachnospiraceae bacterium]|nr:flagellar hook capping protein [Lachnospiraceae bacterium]
MSLAAPIVDGKLVQNTSSAGSTTGAAKETKSNNSMDKDSFLQLLVAQMKYQDPMEPTSNTEYVAQYAQFSELEAMQNLSSNMDIQRATSLVGKEVIMKTTGASGEPVYVQGKVDFVSKEGNKAYLTINGSKYSIDDLDSVVDEGYMNALNLANDFTASLGKLPQLAMLTGEYKDVIQNLQDVYNDMSAYQRSYLDKDTVDKYNQYVDRMKQILAAQESAQTE